MNFNSISFNPGNSALTIATDNGDQTYDLSSSAVELKVTRQTNQLQVAVQTGALGSFSSNGLEVGYKFDSTSAILFDNLSEAVQVDFDGSMYHMGVTAQYHALFIGSDDIRNNRNAAPKQLLLLEGETVSFEIQNNILTARCH